MFVVYRFALRGQQFPFQTGKGNRVKHLQFWAGLGCMEDGQSLMAVHCNYRTNSFCMQCHRVSFGCHINWFWHVIVYAPCWIIDVGCNDSSKGDPSRLLGIFIWKRKIFVLWNSLQVKLNTCNQQNNCHKKQNALIVIVLLTLVNDRALWHHRIVWHVF